MLGNMARMTLADQLATVRALYAAHEAKNLGDDEDALIQLQHEIDERLSAAELFLTALQVRAVDDLGR